MRKILLGNFFFKKITHFFFLCIGISCLTPWALFDVLLWLRIVYPLPAIERDACQYRTLTLGWEPANSRPLCRLLLNFFLARILARADPQSRNNTTPTIANRYVWQLTSCRSLSAQLEYIKNTSRTHLMVRIVSGDVKVAMENRKDFSPTSSSFNILFFFSSSFFFEGNV